MRIGTQKKNYDYAYLFKCGINILQSKKKRLREREREKNVNTQICKEILLSTSTVQTSGTSVCQLARPTTSVLLNYDREMRAGFLWLTNLIHCKRIQKKIHRTAYHNCTKHPSRSKKPTSPFSKLLYIYACVCVVFFFN